MTAYDDMWSPQPSSTSGEPYSLLGVAPPASTSASMGMDPRGERPSERPPGGGDTGAGSPASAPRLEGGGLGTPGEPPSPRETPLATNGDAGYPGAGGDLAQALGHRPPNTPDTDLPEPDGSGQASDEGDEMLARHAALFARHAGGETYDTRSGIQPFDFNQPIRLDEELIQSLKDDHDRLARRLASAMSLYVGTEVWVQVSTISSMRVKAYKEAVSDSVVFANVLLKPRGLDAFWEWGAGVTFALVERLLGGPGHFDHEPRYLTAIETRLFSKLCDKFSHILTRTIHGRVGEHERRAMQADLSQVELGDPNSMLIHVGMELGFEGGSAPFSVAYYLDEFRRTETRQPTADPVVRETVAQTLGGATVEVAVELGHASLTLNEIRQMRPGDVIRLNQRTDQEIIVKIDREARFAGEPGQLEGRRAVRISRVIEEES